LREGASAAATAAARAREPPLWGRGKGEEGRRGGERVVVVPRSRPPPLWWGEVKEKKRVAERGQWERERLRKGGEWSHASGRGRGCENEESGVALRAPHGADQLRRVRGLSK
jgi:hypothetical protein